jgi:hypothetical protein
MRIGVVVSCYRQERFLPRSLAAIERALEGEDWRGVVELALPADDALPTASDRWTVVSAFDRAAGRPGRPLTPGAGRMLGFASCGGEWVLFADPDLEVDAGWMRAAIRTAADGPPRLAGVFGRIEEWFVDGASERPGQSDLYRTGDTDHLVDFLAALALYRREALAASGGFDPRLHSDEDFELGLRLRRMGFEMLSLGRLGARHWSAPRPSFRELGRRWSTGICFGQGQELRLYLGRPGFGELLRRQRLYVATLGMWLLGALALAAGIATGAAGIFLVWCALPPFVIAVMTARKRSVRLAVLSLLTWTIQAAGMVVGFFLVPGDARPLAPAAPALRTAENLSC